MKDKNFHDKVKKKSLCRNLKMHPIQTGKRGINTLRRYVYRAKTVMIIIKPDMT